MLKRPRHEGDYADHGLDCQEALEENILELVDRAVACGWSRSEVLVAVGELADNLMLASLENERLEDKLAQLRGQR